MPPTNRPTAQDGQSVVGSITTLTKALLLDRRYYWVLVGLLTAFEAVLGMLIIWKVPCMSVITNSLIEPRRTDKIGADR
jgi:hypothetical protein